MHLKTSSDGPVENMNACFLCHEKMIVSIHSERGYLTQKMQNQIWIHTNCDHAIARCALELENLAIIIIFTMMHKTMQFCGHNCHQPHLAFPDIFLFDFSVSFFSTNHKIWHNYIRTSLILIFIFEKCN